MDYVQVFNDELQSVLRTKPSISKAKMIEITRAAIKGIKFYKHIVQTVEKFISRCRPEYMISGLYVIDSIVRQSRHQFGPDRDVYTARFSKNICITFETLFSNCLPDDKPKIIRVLNLWQKNGVFEPQIIRPLMDLAETTTSRMFPKSPDSNPVNLGHSSKCPPQIHPNIGLKFNKDLLDFDYGEDDDDEGDETPTEAEPPLSSTLGKIKNKHQSSSPKNEKFHSKQFEQDSMSERWRRATNKQAISGDSTDDLDDSHMKKRSRTRSPQTPTSQPPKTSDFNKTQLSSRLEQKSNEDKELLMLKNSAARQAERAAERERRCLPKIRDKHLTVCSSTLWLGHLPKSVSEVDISDAFGEYGTISSIDLVPPRGCAYVCMDRRQDAKRALDESKDLKLKNSHIKMAWAPGKGFKEYKKLKDFWESDVGASFIPYSKVDHSIDFDILEEGGVIDEDSMSMEMRERRELQTKGKKMSKDLIPQAGLSLPIPPIALINQPTTNNIQSFGMLPPPTSLGIPQPTRFGQGLISFPPPGLVTTSAGNHMTLPPPSSLLLNQGMNTSSTNYQDVSDLEKVEGLSSPPTIDQQLSMTERQISMVEQQLSMIQQAQGIGRGLPSQSVPSMQQPPQLFQHSNQPNPMMFDMSMSQHILHAAQNMMDPSLTMFANHPSNMMMSAHMMVPTNLANNSAMMNLDEGLDEHRGHSF